MSQTAATRENSPITLRHEPARRRFLAEAAEGTGLLEYDTLDPATLDFRHTYVPPELRGRGIAGIVTKFALDYARANALGVVPSCPYVARYLDEHPEYAELRRA